MRTIKERPTSSHEVTFGPGGGVMKVRDLMSKGVVTIEDTATGHDAVGRMMRSGVRHLPVVDRRGALAGVVTDRDLRHYLFEPGTFERVATDGVERLLGAVTVSELMSAPAVSVAADDPIEMATRRMLDGRIGSLPVLEGGRLAGIITETDLLRRVVGDDACCQDVATIVVSYP
jgi:acetoin utilization protein AcuB